MAILHLAKRSFLELQLYRNMQIYGNFNVRINVITVVCIKNVSLKSGVGVQSSAYGTRGERPSRHNLDERYIVSVVEW